MKCAGAAPLLGSRPGELDPAEEAALSAHLSTCEACRARQADQDALARVVENGLLGEAARRDFSSFADGVMARIPASAWQGAATPGLLGRLLELSRRHRVLATASALAPALAALALYLYIGRTTGTGAMEFSVEVTSEDLAPMVLDTSDGPIILVGEASDGT